GRDHGRDEPLGDGRSRSVDEGL
ncbi:MAG: hypothetical protein AVDCRST_MAG93-8257, partial [uncultured Chloroflexia bacterium]